MDIDPAWWERPDMRAALAVRDIGAVYRALMSLGVNQRQIAALTGQSQPEVSQIINGRVVKDYRVLERIAKGLGIPRERMGLYWWAADGSYAGQDKTYAGEVTDAETPEGVSADMLRRHILALGATAAFGAVVKGLGELLDLPGLVPVSTPLPSRVFPVHVAQVRDLTQLLGQLGKMHGPDPSVSSAAAASATRLQLRAKHPEIPWSQIVGMRNRVVHGYFEVDPDVLWNAVSSAVPQLRKQLSGITTSEP